MPIKFLLKDGKSLSLTMSYDDGNYDGDTRLVGIFNKYGIKGSFHLNGKNYVESGWAYDKFDELKELYKGHEVSMHGFTHPWLNKLPKSEIVCEMQKDRAVLENFAGYPVRGMSYPFGAYNGDVLDVLKMLDIKYSRTTHSTGGFNFPGNYLEWHPTCHHNGDISEKFDGFITLPNKWKNEIMLFYIWGHSYEFNQENPKLTWDEMDAFCAKAAEHKDKIWFATNIEIYDYIMATKRVEISYDRKMFYNPSAISVWIATDDGNAVELKPGEITRI